MPIGPKKRYELKGEALMKLQEDLRGIEYIIIDEFSVVGQNMFGWINSRCKQATGLSEKTFGGINVKLVGDRVLYHSNHTNTVATSGYCAYQCFEEVVKLSQNHRASGLDLEQQKFRTMLLHVRDGESSFEDCNALQSQDNKINNAEDFLRHAIKLSFTNEKVIIDA